MTVRGRPVASLGPLEEAALPRVDVDGETLSALLARTPVDDAVALAYGEVLATARKPGRTTEPRTS